MSSDVYVFSEFAMISEAYFFSSWKGLKPHPFHFLALSALGGFVCFSLRLVGDDKASVLLPCSHTQSSQKFLTKDGPTFSANTLEGSVICTMGPQFFSSWKSTFLFFRKRKTKWLRAQIKIEWKRIFQLILTSLSKCPRIDCEICAGTDRFCFEFLSPPGVTRVS